MMKPVAPANDRQIELMKGFWSYYGSPPHMRELNASLLKKDFLSIIARLSDAEERIAELTAALAEARDKALEEAAKAIDSAEIDDDAPGEWVTSCLSALVRALKEKP